MADTRDIRPPAPAPRQTALTSLAALDRQVVAIRQRNLQRQRQRQQLLSAFRNRARHTAYVFFGFLFIAAGMADLLSIVKDAVEAIPVVGWVIGIAASVLTGLCVGIPMYYAQRRVKRMNDETARIAAANSALRQDLEQQFRRLRPTMADARQDGLIQRTDPATIGRSLDFVSYKARIVLNILLVQLLEAIPVVDLGPWQIVKVLRVFIQQQREFRQARNQLLGFQALDQRLRLLERFEREYTEALLSAAVAQAIADEQELAERERRELARTNIVPVV